MDCHIFKPISVTHNIARCVCSKHTTNNLLQENEKFKWTPIYYFPFIRMAGFINRLKFYQSAFTVVAVPASIGLYYYDLTDLTAVSVVSGSAMFTCLSLYIITAFFKRLIGSIFLSDDKKSVKIAHLTFWGRRKDVIFLVEDVVPLTDGNCNANDAFVKLNRYSCDEVLYFTLRFGRVLDKDSFQYVFGSFEILGLKKKI